MSRVGRVQLHLAAMALAALACERASPKPAQPPEVRYDGATTISSKILPALAGRLRERSGVALRVDRGGSGAGLKRVLAGEVDVAGVSRSLDADELAQKPYFQIVGYDALAVWVNQSNPVRALSKADLRGIYGGAIVNWRRVGGRDLPVVACTERLSSERATVEAVQALALDGAAYGPVKELEDPSDCVAFVAADPRGLTAATITYAAPGVHAVSVEGLDPTPENVRSSRYLLTRPLLLVSRERPAPGTPAAALFDAALSPEGQAAIAAAGFVPAR